MSILEIANASSKPAHVNRGFSTATCPFVLRFHRRLYHTQLHKNRWECGARCTPNGIGFQKTRFCFVLLLFSSFLGHFWRLLRVFTSRIRDEWVPPPGNRDTIRSCCSVATLFGRFCVRKASLCINSSDRRMIEHYLTPHEQKEEKRTKEREDTEHRSARLLIYSFHINNDPRMPFSSISVKKAPNSPVRAPFGLIMAPQNTEKSPKISLKNRDFAGRFPRQNCSCSREKPPAEGHP